MSKQSRQSKGGEGRAQSLTPERRKEIAKAGADARWGKSLPQASHDGVLRIGDIELLGAVLQNGKRLLSQGTFLQALGRSRSPKAGTGGLSTVDGTPFFLQADVLKPFISKELLLSTTPIFFRLKSGARTVGYDAELLPMVAEVYLKFRDQCASQGKEVPRQYAHIVTACDILMRGLAKVGIIALVDEATGFQADRARDALAKILEEFISDELRRWVKTFPDAYFRELCRLQDKPYRADMKMPRYFGHITNDVIYDRLAPAVLATLRERNPAEAGRRKHKHHQWLTDGIGHPKLLEHLGAVVAMMRLSDTWESFMEKLNDLAPSYKKHPLLAQAKVDAES